MRNHVSYWDFFQNLDQRYAEGIILSIIKKIFYNAWSNQAGMFWPMLLLTSTTNSKKKEKRGSLFGCRVYKSSGKVQHLKWLQPLMCSIHVEHTPVILW